MRVSTDSDRQVLDLQRDALLAAGVDERHLFEDRTSGSRSDRAGLAKALAFLRPGDCLVVWKLDRLGRGARGGGAAKAGERDATRSTA
jgi:DNA invertase Pin-like site-specific DNA recombinase